MHKVRSIKFYTVNITLSKKLAKLELPLAMYQGVLIFPHLTSFLSSIASHENIRPLPPFFLLFLGALHSNNADLGHPRLP